MTIIGAHDLDAIISGLKRRFETDHFLIHYGLRNSSTGKGLGHHGVRSVEVVKAYAKALEISYQTLRNEPWNRPDLASNGLERTPVYIYDIPNPVTIPCRRRVPAIILPPGNNELTEELEIQRAMAMAAHEVAHVFNFREHPMTETAGRRWAWFDEGLAICLEEWALPGNRDHYRFLMNWINRPEIPLDNRNAVYQTGMFVRYLAARFGRGFVNDVWTKSRREESPFEAIDRMLHCGLKLVSAGATGASVFSDYCRDAYFLRDPASPCFAPSIQERFGDRAVAESFMLRPGSGDQASSELDHLACRYFRFTLDPEVKRLIVHLRTYRSDGRSPLKAELAVVKRTGEQGVSETLQPAGATEPAQLIGEIAIPKPDKIDHIVLIVTNCGLRPELANVYLPHDDGQQFTIDFAAE